MVFEPKPASMRLPGKVIRYYGARHWVAVATANGLITPVMCGESNYTEIMARLILPNGEARKLTPEDTGAGSQSAPRH